MWGSATSSKYADGDDAGTFVTNISGWQVESEFIGDSNRLFRITAIIPVERIEEFIDGPRYEVWEVERA
jgi:hypothetical protein